MDRAARFIDALRGAGSILVGNDQIGPSTDPRGFPYTNPSANVEPIGSLFPAEITNKQVTDMYKRYQLGRRIIDDPVDDALANGFIPTDDSLKPLEEKQAKQCFVLYERHKTRINRYLKLVKLYGASALAFGFVDTQYPGDWARPVTDGTLFNFTQPIPRPTISQVKTTNYMPQEIEWIQFSFGQGLYTSDPSRFLWSFNPALTEESVEGESALAPVFNVLRVQIHADWSIGQQLWRNAGGLLAMYAPKRNFSPQDKLDAIGSVANHNSKTVVYVPPGWMLKEVLRKAGNIAIGRTYDVVIKQIAAGCGIPPSILLGSTKSNIFSKEGSISEDQATYFRLLHKQQENFIGPQLQKFFRIGQKAGLIDPGPIHITFPSQELLTTLEKTKRLTKETALVELNRRLRENPTGFTEEQLIKIAGM